MMFELTGFQRDLLYVIAGLDHPSGQRIKEVLTEDRGEVNPGRLYPNLNTLVDIGYVEKGTKNKRTNYYQITELGIRIIRDRRQWENRHLPISI
jgi:DNA-binding PadR family transcriptional regulator